MRRPGAVTAAAIMAIVFGGMGTLGGLCGGGFLLMQSSLPEDPIQKQIDDIRERDVPGFKGYNAATVFFSLAESLSLLIAGIGLLGMRRWARLLAIVASTVSICTSVAGAFYYFAFIYPTTRQAFRVLRAQQEAPVPIDVLGPMEIFMVGAEGLGAIMSLTTTVYVIFIIFLLTRSRVRAAFYDATPADLQERLKRFDDLGGYYGDDDRPGPLEDRGRDDPRPDNGNGPDDRFR